MFSKAQLDRYARHIILPGVGAAGQRRLLDAAVLVVGAGGLGSPALLYLAAAGVGRLGVLDDDRVELTNLQRQVIHHSRAVGTLKVLSAQAALDALNPDVSVEAIPERLTRSNARQLIGNWDLVIDGSDNFPTRYLVNDACVLEGIPLLYGAVSQFEGQVSLFNVDRGGLQAPCYRCLFPVPPQGEVPTCAEAGVFGALTGVIGTLMATEALKFLLDLGEPLAGTLLHYDALAATSHRFRVPRNPECAVCGDHPTIEELIDYELFCSAGLPQSR